MLGELGTGVFELAPAGAHQAAIDKCAAIIRQLVGRNPVGQRKLAENRVTMVIIPSLIPWRDHYARTKHLLSTNAGLCKDPWTDEPENIGYRY